MQTSYKESEFLLGNLLMDNTSLLPFLCTCGVTEAAQRRRFGEHLGCARMCQALWWDSDVVLLAPLRAARHAFDPSIEGSRIRPLNRAGDCSVPPTPFGEVK